MPGAKFLPTHLNDLSADVALVGPAQGDVFFRSGSRWVNLPAGQAGQVLMTNGPGADPGWGSLPVVTNEGEWSYTAQSFTPPGTDPGNGKFRTDQTTWGASGYLAVSTLATGNVDRSAYLADLVVNDTVQINTKATSGNFVRYRVTALPTPNPSTNPTWYLIPVSVEDVGGVTPSGNTACLLTFEGTGGQPVVGPGGPANAIQYSNGSGGFAGSAGFTFDGAQLLLQTPGGYNYDIFDILDIAGTASIGFRGRTDQAPGPGIFLGIDHTMGTTSITGAGLTFGRLSGTNLDLPSPTGGPLAVRVASYATALKVNQDTTVNVAGVLQTLAPASGAGVTLTLAASNAVSGNTPGGNVVLTPGAGFGTGVAGQVVVTGSSTSINSVTYTWPSVQGGASTVLTNDGSGGLTWAAAGGGGGGTPAAPVNSVQFNNAGAFGGSANLVWTGTALSSPGAGGSSEHFGLGSTAAGTNGVAFGYGASASAANSVAIGQNSSASNVAALAIGSAAVASSSNSCAVGVLATAAGANSFAMGENSSVSSSAAYGIAIGHSAAVAATHQASVAIGESATTTAANQMMIGSSPALISQVVFAATAVKISAGAPASGAGNALTLAGSNAVSGNTNGGNVVLTPGAGFGTGVAGQILAGINGVVNDPVYSFASDPATGIWSPGTYQFAISIANTCQVRASTSFWLFNASIDLRWANAQADIGTADVGLTRVSAGVLGVTNGAAGTGTLSTGGLKVNGVPYTWPNVQGGASTVLTNDGSGTLSWAAAGGGTPGGSSGQLQFNNAGAFGGTVAVVYSTAGSLLTVTAQVPTDKPLTIVGAAAQSANLTEWQNSAGAAFAYLTATGIFAVGKVGGTVGTTELQISHDGNNVKFINKKTSGSFIFPVGTSFSLCDSTSGAYWNIRQNTGPAFTVYSGGSFAWSNSSGAEGPLDTHILRVVPGVIRAGGLSDGSGAGWFQNPGTKRLLTQASNATVTMQSLTDLTVTLQAGRKYVGYITLFARDTVAADGLSIDLNGGTATFTYIAFGFTGMPGVSAFTNGFSGAAGTQLAITNMGGTADVAITIAVTIVCNAAGTLIPRYAQTTHSTGTAFVEQGSFIKLEDCYN
jgi:hypothetical protein